LETPKSATPFDPTIDSSPEVIARPPLDQPQVDSHRAVEFVHGSTPELSAETNDLLRDRLRVASLLLCSTFLTFFVWRLFSLDQVQTKLDWAIFAAHATVTFLTGIIGVRLCTKCPQMRRHVRIAEVLIFGGSAVFFLLLSWSMLATSAREGYLRTISPIWLLLIFTYALYVPNTWRRAAIVIVAMASGPLLLMIGFRLASTEFIEVTTQRPAFQGYLFEVSAVIVFSSAIAVWGVYTIGLLRRQAFEAKQLGQYRLKRQIGVGGMGEVYLAENVLLKRPCAIKLMRREKAGDSKVLARFEREVKATAKLTHWNTIEIFDYGRADDGTFYYVMEYLPGLNLGQLVEMNGPLSAARTIYLLAQICDALEEAHRGKLIHRDLKPGNIFAANRGGVYDVAKLLDFGLAKPLVEIDEDAQITQEGAITGSPLFMSPEQAFGDRPPDARSDIYGIGAVAYYMLSGQPPFSDPNPMRVLAAHMSEDPKPLTASAAAVPADLDAVVLRCLEKKPENRFQTAAALRDALAECESNISDRWTREAARQWWECHGCPHKKALDAEVFDVVNSGASLTEAAIH